MGLKTSTITLITVLSTALAQQKQLYSSYAFDPLEHLAGVSPYFQPEDPPRSPNPPEGCTVIKAAYLVRHAAINANDFDYESYLEPFTDKLKNATVDWSKIPILSFLSTWSPPNVSQQELLTRTGKLEAGQLGVQISYRYPNARLPQRVWTSSAERTVVSAKSLVRGLEMDDNTISLVTIDEGKQAGANSLTPYSSCQAYSSSAGSKQSSMYVDRYTAPILSRFQSLAPGFNWTSDDIVGMFEWCGYDSVIRGSSPFCSLDLFSPDEWLSFEYAQDVQYHYNTGYGNPISGAIGFPWLNATVGLLSGNSSSSTNNPDQDLYISFTHRELPPTVLVAMGLFNNSEFSGANNVNDTMPLDRVNFGRRWQSSYILPFLTNIAVEKMDCPGSYGYMNQNGSSNIYYRVLVNQAPQTLPGCSDGPNESCSETDLMEFVRSRASIVGGYTEMCGNNYTNSTDVLSIYQGSDNGTVVGRRWTHV